MSQPVHPGAIQTEEIHVRRNMKRFAVLPVVGALALAGCGEQEKGDQQAAGQEQAQEEDSEGGEDLDEKDLEKLTGKQPSPEDMEDPNEQVDDGVFAGAGVVLPVPEGWQLDPAAFQQGAVLGASQDQSQQMSARAIDVEEAKDAGQEMDFDTLLETIREGVDQDPDVDEEVDLQGAERGHRLTYLGVPAQQEGASESSVTILLAESGDGYVGEFTYAAQPDGYDEQIADRLVDEAGFDPDSEPPAMPQAPAPEGGGDGDGAQEQPDDAG